jgi:hypothetical protein
MNYDHRLRLMALYLFAFLAAVATVNWLANPYGAWPVSAIDPIYRKGGAERVATPFRLRAEQPTIMLVGSSRVMFGMKIEQGARYGVLNAGLPAANLDEIAAVIEVALENPGLKRVIWGLDFFAFDNNVAGILDPQTRQRLAGDARLKIMETLLSLDALDLSRRLLVRAMSGRRNLPAVRTMPIPWTQEMIRGELARPGRNDLDQMDRSIIEGQLGYWIPVYSNYQWSDSRMALFQGVVARARRAGVDVIVFIPPLSGYELEALRQSGRWETFQRWKRLIAAAGPYWDFSGYNEIAQEADLFNDVAHYKPAVGFTILRRLLGEDCSRCGDKARRVLDSGLWVEPATVDRVLAIQEDRKTAFLNRKSPYSRIVEELRLRPFAGKAAGANAQARSNRNQSARAPGSIEPDPEMPALLRDR